MKKSIDIHGISTTATYKDGNLLKCVNMRKKNGVHKPVTPRKVTRTTTEQYVYEFQHNLPQVGENLIGVRNNNIYLVGTNTETLLTSVTGFKSITQIGNLLQVLDATGIKILWWVDTEYKLIESNFSGGQTATELLPVKVDLKVDGEKMLLPSINTQERKTYNYYTDNSYPSSTLQTSAEKDALAIMTKARSILNREGKLTGFIMACTAIELYDGNYILQSNPILLGQAWDERTRYNMNYNGVQYDYITNPATYYIAEGTYQLISDETDDRSYERAVKYISIHDWDQTDPNGTLMTNEIYPNMLSAIIPIKIGTAATSRRMVAMASCNELKFKVNSNISQDLKPLIKSVSIFISKQVYNYDETKAKYIGYYNFNDSASAYSENYIQIPKTTAEILKELTDNQQFYKVHEIPFDDIKTTTANDGWVTIDLKDKLGENLTMQEELPVDNFTHHNLLPNAQIVYNSKLHAMDYKQELFHGWPLPYMYAQQGIGQFPALHGNIMYGNAYWTEVHIKNENGTSTVIRKKLDTTFNQFELPRFGMLSYPDSRAYKIIVYVQSSSIGYYKQEFKLTASTSHNFAYYINADLKPFNLTYTEGQLQEAPTETNRTIIYRNAMKVSSVNNPFYFPSDTTFTIGTGILLNAGTNAQRMSEGQFGQYDLYVLTTEGLYSLDTGTTIAYNRQSPASLEIPTSAIICATPFGVVFVGKRGLYIINGQQTELISAQIEETSQANSIYGASLSFLTYLKTLKDILYDPNQNELIVVSTAHDYNWVLNIDNKMWYMSTEKIDFEVKNSSPNLLVVAGKTIKDYSQSQTNKAAVALITRPIYFGIDEVKQLQRGILRGRVYQMNTLANSNDLFYSLFGSNDGTNHTILRGFRMLNTKQDRDYKDFDSGMIARSTYRNYSVAFEATVDERSEISHIDFEVADNYKNDKMR